MARVVGPLDKRKRVTRCQPCAKRRIKCQGGLPCEYCNRTNKICNPQTIALSTVGTTLNAKFVHYRPARQMVATPATIPLQSTHSNGMYVSSFAALLYRCQFTKDFTNVARDLIPLMETSPPLRDLAIAIGALDLSRRASIRASPKQESPKYIAYHSYSRSLQSLQQRLQTRDTAVCEDVAWSTFLLGLFELMAEPSGEGWAKHMFYGTSKVLQLAGPDAPASPLRQRLFNAFRVLEANRAILYGDDTFLSESKWEGKWGMHNITNYKEAGIVDPTTKVIGLMIQTSSFSKRLFEQLESIPADERVGNATTPILAFQGAELFNRILNCHHGIQLLSGTTDAFSQLSLVNCCAVQLFHCRNFTYYKCWQPGTVPVLSKPDIRAHVGAITCFCEEILQTSNIPGALLLFPLRMAGAHAEFEWQRDKILRLLQQVYNHGFVVADRIKTDLCDFWHYQRGQN